MDDLIRRQDAIEALWKALYEYEDKTEKQFQESEDLDISEWILHRIFVQNMSDIDRHTILELPSAQPEPSTEIQEILNYLDTTLHPIISPDNWNVYAELHDMVSELPSAQQNWIPCSEPPEESGTYIVTAYDGIDKRVTFVKYQKTLKRWDLTGARAYWRILAYKPLPEPYKGENDG